MAAMTLYTAFPCVVRRTMTMVFLCTEMARASSATGQSGMMIAEIGPNHKEIHEKVPRIVCEDDISFEDFEAALTEGDPSDSDIALSLLQKRVMKVQGGQASTVPAVENHDKAGKDHHNEINKIGDFSKAFDTEEFADAALLGTSRQTPEVLPEDPADLAGEEESLEGHEGSEGHASIEGHEGEESLEGLEGEKGHESHPKKRLSFWGHEDHQGPPGHQGHQGHKGHRGTEGQKGHLGEKGHVGWNGPPGPRGPIGPSASNDPPESAASAGMLVGVIFINMFMVLGAYLFLKYMKSLQKKSQYVHY
jgi:hypothetical protein